MASPAKTDGPSKFARYRASQKRKGLKLLRIWVPDVTAPGFAEEAARQVKIINAAPELADVDAFLDAALTSLDIEPYDWGPDGPPSFENDPTRSST